MTTSKKAQKLQYGLLDDKPIHISEAPFGGKFGCVCPVCGVPLVAKRGSLKTPHFAHSIRNPDCRKKSESIIHILAKQVIENNGFVYVPDITGKGIKRKFLGNIELEKNISNYIADIYSIDKKGNDFIIEIAFRHESPKEKQNFYVANKINSLEINIGGMLKTNFEETVIKTAPRKWIYCSDLDPNFRETSTYNERYAVFNRTPEQYHDIYNPKLLRTKLNWIRYQYGSIKKHEFQGEIKKVNPGKYGIPARYNLFIYCDDLPPEYDNYALIEIFDIDKVKFNVDSKAGFFIDSDPSKFVFNKRTQKAVFFPRAYKIRALK